LPGSQLAGVECSILVLIKAIEEWAHALRYFVLTDSAVLIAIHAL
jgi:hypothetical protein